jgi:biotin-dependent carboxylase-like uncharacterized protein
MPILEFIRSGLLTTVQDLGRSGSRFYAIPSSGVMDGNAARIALLLLQEQMDAPVIECTSLAPAIRFHGPARIALTGADFHWTINDQPVALNAVLDIMDGDVLVGKHASDQLRGYLSVAGKWTGEPVYGSHSTYLNGKFGGYEGRILQKGDRIEWIYKEAQDLGVPVIGVRKGPEFEWLSEKAKSILFNSPFTIGVESNRMGARLQGPILESKSYQLVDSAPVLPGFIQLPPTGQPIVVLQDGQVTGGYPRIAYIPERYLGIFNQIPLGKEVRFCLDLV